MTQPQSSRADLSAPKGAGTLLDCIDPKKVFILPRPHAAPQVRLRQFASSGSRREIV